MLCLLIIDDDIECARLLAESLKVALGGKDNIVCLPGVSAYRLWRRQGRADLILVELMRHQSNGFSLAAALARQSKTPVVLLSDRKQTSDIHWASARGIPHVLSRQRGTSVLAQEIAVLLGRASERPAAEQIAASSLASIDEFCSNPSSTMLECLLEDLRQWNPHQSNERWIVTNGQSDSLSWLKNLLCFIGQPAPRAAIKAWVSQNHATAGITIRAREQVLFDLVPEPASMLRCLAVKAAGDIFECLHSTHGLSESSNLNATAHFMSCRHLLNALSFLPGAGAINDAADNNLTVRDFVAKIQFVLNIAASTKSRPSHLPANFVGMMHVLSELPVQPTLTEACLMLTTLGVKQPCQRLLHACLAERYRLPGNDAPNSSQNIQLPKPWLADCLAAIGNKLDCEAPVHQRLSYVMVSVYKLRARLDIYAEQSEAASSSLRRWQILATCLYEYTCLGVLRTNVLTELDLRNLGEVMRDLQHCARQGVLPPNRLLINLAAAEICAARRSQSTDGQEHQTLSAQLHRLPKPDAIVTGLQEDIGQSGSLMSEIGHELQLLTEVAHRLGVERVESLSRLMHDVYKRLSAQPDLLQDKHVRLILNRSHRVLCRLLDQAAAWRPLDERSLESSVRDVINALFLLFPEQRAELRRKSTTLTELAAGGRVEQITGWTQCHSINGRLRQILRRRRNLEEYRSLMLELLREQHRLIATYLPYQPAD